jgi:hypothetical protein
MTVLSSAWVSAKRSRSGTERVAQHPRRVAEGVNPAEILAVGLTQSRRYTSILPRILGTKH